MKFSFSKKNTNTQKGFTILETLIAIFILVMALQSLLGLISSSFFSSIYAKNEITATFMAQEVVDTIRNDRDTIAFLKNTDLPTGWAEFLRKYGYDGGVKTLCFTAEGCRMEPTKDEIVDCGDIDTDCPSFLYDESTINKDYYTYDTNVEGAVPTTFRRQVYLSINPFYNFPDELDIKVIIHWKNGNLDESRVLRASLLGWRSIVTPNASCPEGLTGSDCNVCLNGYEAPSCQPSNGVCQNPLHALPDCTSCTNGYEYPDCNPPSCQNGATNYPDCDNNVCNNGATNWPQCDNNSPQTCPAGIGDFPDCNHCLNGSPDFPACPDSCPPGLTHFPQCDQCLNGSPDVPACPENVQTCWDGSTSNPCPPEPRPQIQANPLTINYNSCASDTQFVTLSNTGNGDLNINPPPILPPNANSDLTTPRLVPPGLSTDVYVNFWPDGDTNDKNDIMTIQSNDPDQPQLNINLHGTCNGGQ